MEKIYLMRYNWHLLKPFLNDEDVIHTLDRQMGIFCAMYSKDIKIWKKNHAPWELTTSGDWDNKPAPQKDTLEWYRFFGGCHWINVFTAKLIEKALNVEAYIWQTDSHSVVKFVKDDVTYYADVLNDWSSVQNMKNFMNLDSIPDF
ncbi:MAG: hypothetical protein WAM95_06125 [Bacillus sp. (in: firmicutes)]